MFPSPRSDLTCKPLSDIATALIFFELRFNSAAEPFNATLRPLVERVRAMVPGLPACEPIAIFSNEAWRQLLFASRTDAGIHGPALAAMMRQLTPLGEEILRCGMAYELVRRVRPGICSSATEFARFVGAAPASCIGDKAAKGTFCEYFYARRAGFSANFALGCLRHPGGKSRARAHEALLEAYLRTDMPDDRALTAILADAHHLQSRPWRAGDPAAGRTSTQPPWQGRCIASSAPIPLTLKFCSFMWYANRTLPANRDKKQPLRMPPYRPAQPAFGLPAQRAPGGALDDPDPAQQAGQMVPSVDLAVVLEREHARAHPQDSKQGPGPRTYAPDPNEDIQKDDFVHARVHSFRGRAVVNQLRREIQEAALRAVRAAGDGLVLCCLKGRGWVNHRVMVLDLHDTFPALFVPELGLVPLDLDRNANRFFFLLMILAMRHQSESVCFYAARFD